MALTEAVKMDRKITKRLISNMQKPRQQMLKCVPTQGFIIHLPYSLLLNQNKKKEKRGQ
jgi:hypothetical protein